MHNIFRAIYVEETVFSLSLTNQVLGKLKSVPVIPVRHYKDVFNRPRQNLYLQKEKPAILLGAQTGQPFYPGPAICQSFGSDRFFYASLLQNCLFDCQYCFLQGMYPSADLLAFMNLHNYEQALAQIASQGPAYIALSHDADLLSCHSVVPYLSSISHWWQTYSDLTFEVRTKSAHTALLRETEPHPQLVFAFSLAPQAVINRYERKTPGLRARLAAVKAAQDAGHQIRLCFDPVFTDPDLAPAYETFFEEIFTTLALDKVKDISYGFFRLPMDIHQRITKKRPDAAYLRAGLETNDGVVSFSARDQSAVQTKHLAVISRFYPLDQVFFYAISNRR